MGEAEGYGFVVAAGEVVDFGDDAEEFVNDGLSDSFAAAEGFASDLYAALAAAVAAFAFDLHHKVCAVPELQNFPAEQLVGFGVGFAAACPAGYVLFFEFVAFGDGCYAVVAKVERHVEGVIDLLACGSPWVFDNPFVPSVFFKEGHHEFEVAVETYGVPVGDVEQAFAIRVVVPGFVAGVDEFVRPGTVNKFAFSWVAVSVVPELVLLVETEPLLRFAFDGSRDGFSFEGFRAGDFEDGVSVVAGFERLLDDAGEVYAVEVVLIPACPFAVVDGALDVEVHAAYSGAVVVDGGGYVDLLLDFAEDVDSFAPVLQDLAGVRQPVDCGYKFAGGGLPGGGFDEPFGFADWSAFGVVEHFIGV